MANYGKLKIIKIDSNWIIRTVSEAFAILKLTYCGIVKTTATKRKIYKDEAGKLWALIEMDLNSHDKTVTLREYVGLIGKIKNAE